MKRGIESRPESLNPDERLKALVNSYRVHKRNHETLLAGDALRKAIELAEKELLDTSPYNDIPELQEKHSHFKDKADKASYYEEAAEEHDSKGDTKTANAYRKAAEKLRGETAKEE